MRKKDIKIDKNCKIYPNVQIGKGSVIEGPSIIGRPTKDGKTSKTMIGSNCIIRAFTTIYAGTKIGKNSTTGHGVLIRENNIIGSNVSVGTNTVLEPDNLIGNNVRIHSNCFLERSRIEDNVFIGPNVVFTDDLHPPCPKYKECKGGARVKKSARLGASVTVLPGVVIGKNSLVGAGSVVRKNVPSDTVVAGNPAKRITNISQLRCIKGFFKRPYSR